MAFLYESSDEVVKMIRQPVPDEVRQSGFAQAKKSDVFQHRLLLFRLWRLPEAAYETIDAPVLGG
jgi:hypothetical protein